MPSKQTKIDIEPQLSCGWGRLSHPRLRAFSIEPDLPNRPDSVFSDVVIQLKQSYIAFDRFYKAVHFAAEHLLRNAQRVAFHRMERYMRW
jgi:hypothetical protein